MKDWQLTTTHVLCTIFVSILTLIFLYYKWMHSHWKRKGLPYLEPSIPLGTLENPFTRKYSPGEWTKKLYDEFKARGLKHGGFYALAVPTYMAVDPEYVKRILQTDFQHFADKPFYYNEIDDPLSAHLVAISGKKWRNLRTKLTPTFSSGKMKMMFDIMMRCSIPMQEIVEKSHHNKESIDIREMLENLTADGIASCAFGLDCNSFQNHDTEFLRYGRKLLAPNNYGLILLASLSLFPKLGRMFRLKLYPTDITDFFFNVIRDAVNYREDNHVVRKDMLQLMIDLKNNAPKEDQGEHDGKSLTIEEIAGQAFVFFIAGFETSSTTMTFCLYELATNRDIQDKVREEINETMKEHGEKLTYEAISEMKYLDQVVYETLRKYPPGPFLPRICVDDYKIPGTDVVLEKGRIAIISVLGLHRDPEYYPDPERFDPERFSDENKKKRHPFSFIPFGGGPRICIGLRFGIMQVKVGIAVLLRDYRFSLNKKTEVPLQFSRYSLLLATIGKVWLDTEKIE